MNLVSRVRKLVSSEHTKFGFEVLERERACEVIPCFMEDFPGSVNELTAACRGESFRDCDDNNNFYDYRNTFVSGVRNAETGDWTCAAIIVEVTITKNRKKNRVWELIWLATKAGCKGRGYGSSLFCQLHNIAVKDEVTAIIVESSNKAITFWLTRPHVPIATWVLRSVTGRPDLLATRLSSDALEEQRNNVIMRELFTADATGSSKKKENGAFQKKKKKIECPQLPY